MAPAGAKAKTWLCSRCGFWHPAAHAVCAWCDKGNKGGKPSRAPVTSANGWIDYGLRGRSRERLPPQPPPQARPKPAMDRSWTEAVRRSSRAVKPWPAVRRAAVQFQAGAVASGAAAAKLTIWRNGAWASLADSDEEQEDDFAEEEEQSAEKAALLVKHKRRVEDRTMLTTMRKSLA